MAATDLITVAEFKEHYPITGATQDARLAGLVSRASEVVTAFCDFVLIAPLQPLTEFHTLPWPARPELYLRDRPVNAITEVAEGEYIGGVWTPSLVLAATDYVLSAPVGKLIRLDQNGRKWWPTNFRGVRVKYKPGYTDTASVPGNLKAVVLRLCAVVWAEVDRKSHGVQASVEAGMSVTRFSAARLTPDMVADLRAGGFVRDEVGSTGERDA